MQVDRYKGAILTAQGVLTWIDEEDFDRLNKTRWNYRFPTGYIFSKDGRFLHREALGLKRGDPDVDHINRKPWDNQKANLRLATKSQNQWNRRPAPCDGVYRPPRCTKKPWVGKVRVAMKTYYTKNYATREEAVEARKELKRRLHGEFAGV